MSYCISGELNSVSMHQLPCPPALCWPGLRRLGPALDWRCLPVFSALRYLSLAFPSSGCGSIDKPPRPPALWESRLTVPAASGGVQCRTAARLALKQPWSMREQWLASSEYLRASDSVSGAASSSRALRGHTPRGIMGYCRTVCICSAVWRFVVQS